jgi:hypothetical protein
LAGSGMKQTTLRESAASLTFYVLVLIASQTDSCFVRHEFDVVRKPAVESLQGEAYCVVTRACANKTSVELLFGEPACENE